MRELNGVTFFWFETGTEGGHWAFQDGEYITGDQFSYEGLHVLHDGDFLTIYDKDDPQTVVWEGEIVLNHFAQFQEEALGFWIHADQNGMDRESWARLFMEEHPAKLIKSTAKRRP